ncbi:M48 family metalloprotease [Gallaecimonas sp. GXIMD4217]|uniref:M48 family metalloprotease n=1 Tax=Gallaecimonas sp. GXIMD4217 TaxID=3131927 RepID=UPI00311AFA97
MKIWLQSLALLAALLLIMALASHWLLGIELWLALLMGAGVILFLGPLGSPQLMLRLHGARPLRPGEAPALEAMVLTLARRAGLAQVPRLYLLPSPRLNALALGTEKDGALAVTLGLLDSLPPRECFAVLAHEMSHLAQGDVRLMTMADMLSRMTALLANLAFLVVLLLFPFWLFGTLAISPLALLLLMLAPLVSSLLVLALSRTREFAADEGAVRLTGDPEALILALERLERIERPWWQGLWSRTQPSTLLLTHPPKAQRQARLARLPNQPHLHWPH